MAAVIELERLRRVLELHCSCCLQLFAEPVRLTDCGHSFCRGCILRYCLGRPRSACPLCRRGFQLQHLRPNRELAALLSLIPRELKEQLETQQEPEPDGAAACNDRSSAGRRCGEKVRPEAALSSIPRHPGASPPDSPGLLRDTAGHSGVTSRDCPGTSLGDIPGIPDTQGLLPPTFWDSTQQHPWDSPGFHPMASPV